MLSSTVECFTTHCAEEHVQAQNQTFEFSCASTGCCQCSCACWKGPRMALSQIVSAYFGCNCSSIWRLIVSHCAGNRARVNKQPKKTNTGNTYGICVLHIFFLPLEHILTPLCVALPISASTSAPNQSKALAIKCKESGLVTSILTHPEILLSSNIPFLWKFSVEELKPSLTDNSNVK